MAGLVLGVTVSEDSTSIDDSQPHQRLRLVAEEEPVQSSDAVIRGFAVQGSPRTVGQGLTVPGPPLVLTRGETTSIMVVNRMSEPTTVHSHMDETDQLMGGLTGSGDRKSVV